jgi:hypothetical protein
MGLAVIVASVGRIVLAYYLRTDDNRAGVAGLVLMGLACAVAMIGLVV